MTGRNRPEAAGGQTSGKSGQSVVLMGHAVAAQQGAPADAPAAASLRQGRG